MNADDDDDNIVADQEEEDPPRPLAFYETSTGRLPVRDWLLTLTKNDRMLIGIELAKIEYGWPIGMPLCRLLSSGMWELRTVISNNKQARVLFCVYDGYLWALNGFIKKTQKTPRSEINKGLNRMMELIK